MEANLDTQIAAKRFAQRANLDIVTYVGVYDGYPAYNATNEMLKGTCYGFPIYILVRKNEDRYECRFTTHEESLKIMSMKK